MDPQKPPGIRIEAILLEGFSYKKADYLDLRKSYNITINLNNIVQLLDQKQGRLRSALKITESGGGLFELELVYCLYASVIESEANMSLEDFLRNNAPPMLYQFSRETVLSLTQKAGIPTVLPPINMNVVPQVVSPSTK
jgi:preprotein translocase subunit SecB